MLVYFPSLMFLGSVAGVWNGGSLVRRAERRQSTWKEDKLTLSPC